MMMRLIIKAMMMITVVVSDDALLSPMDQPYQLSVFLYLLHNDDADHQSDDDDNGDEFFLLQGLFVRQIKFAFSVCRGSSMMSVMMRKEFS